MLSTLLITCTACGKAKEEPDIPVGSSSEAMKETAAKAYEENLGMDKEEAEEFAEQVWGEEDSNVDTSAQDSESNLNPQLYTAIDNMEIIDRRIFDIAYDDTDKFVELYGKPDSFDGANTFSKFDYDNIKDNLNLSVILSKFDQPRVLFYGKQDALEDYLSENVKQHSTITWNDNLASLFDENGAFNKNYDYSAADIDYATFVADYCGGIEGTAAVIKSYSDSSYARVCWYIEDCPLNNKFLIMSDIPTRKTVAERNNDYHRYIKICGTDGLLYD